MPARIRKLIGSVLLLAFVLFYIGLMAGLAARLPNSAWVKFIFFALAGTAWGVPILPLLSWMNGGR